MSCTHCYRNETKNYTNASCIKTALMRLKNLTSRQLKNQPVKKCQYSWHLRSDKSICQIKTQVGWKFIKNMTHSTQNFTVKFNGVQTKWHNIHRLRWKLSYVNVAGIDIVWTFDTSDLLKWDTSRFNCRNNHINRKTHSRKNWTDVAEINTSNETHLPASTVTAYDWMT